MVLLPGGPALGQDSRLPEVDQTRQWSQITTPRFYPRPAADDRRQFAAGSMPYQTNRELQDLIFLTLTYIKFPIRVSTYGNWSEQKKTRNAYP